MSFSDLPFPLQKLQRTAKETRDLTLRQEQLLYEALLKLQKQNNFHLLVSGSVQKSKPQLEVKLPLCSFKNM